MTFKFGFFCVTRLMTLHGISEGFISSSKLVREFSTVKCRSCGSSRKGISVSNQHACMCEPHGYPHGSLACGSEDLLSRTLNFQS